MIWLAARRRVASSKMKQIKQAGGSKEREELEEDNEELFTDIGSHANLADSNYYI